MYFKQILNEQLGCASYVIASRQSNDCAIVDPAIDTEPYERILEHREFTLRWVIDTHVHADHVSGARKLAATHNAQVCLHESAQVAYPVRGLTDGEEIPLGQLRLKVLHTPGHRPELISLLVSNPARSPEPSLVLTADCLLVGDMGRPDFGGGNAAAQYESLSRLLRLPDWVAVFPGHFEGACGKGMCGRPSTTIGFERLYNPLARLERREFVERLSSGIPARPLNLSAIEATNRGTADMPWAMLSGAAVIPRITPLEIPEGALLLDVREPEEYAHGHVPGSINIPQADLALRYHELPLGRPVVVVCQAGYRSYRSAQFLHQVGLSLLFSLQGGVEAWEATGQSLAYPETTLERPRIQETEWSHAGALAYSI